MIYKASNYMEGIDDHFQANQLLFISVSDPDPDPNPLFWQHWYQVLINLTNYDTIRKKKKKYILKVDRFIVMLNSVDYFLKVTMLSSSDLFWAELGSGSALFDEFKFLKINSIQPIQLKKIHTGGILKG